MTLFTAFSRDQVSGARHHLMEADLILNIRMNMIVITIDLWIPRAKYVHIIWIIKFLFSVKEVFMI